MEDVDRIIVIFRRVVRVNNFLKLVAVRGVNMQTGNLVSGGVANEAAQAISNVRALLNVAGCSLNNIVQMSGRLIRTADVPTLDLAWANAYAIEGVSVSTKHFFRKHAYHCGSDFHNTSFSLYVHCTF
jgi:enamine deaminase RidA (YjgF/YER057c/UK114 family)